jgi:hypothetical protein
LRVRMMVAAADVLASRDKLAVATVIFVCCGARRFPDFGMKVAVGRFLAILRNLDP